MTHKTSFKINNYINKIKKNEEKISCLKCQFQQARKAHHTIRCSELVKEIHKINNNTRRIHGKIKTEKLLLCAKKCLHFLCVLMRLTCISTHKLTQAHIIALAYESI